MVVGGDGRSEQRNSRGEKAVVIPKHPHANILQQCKVYNDAMIRPDSGELISMVQGTKT